MKRLTLAIVAIFLSYAILGQPIKVPSATKTSFGVTVLKMTPKKGPYRELLLQKEDGSVIVFEMWRNFPKIGDKKTVVVRKITKRGIKAKLI